MADAYRPLSALEHEWNIEIHVALKLEFVSLSPEHLENVGANVWQTHWPANWPEYLQSMCFYARQINVQATRAVDVDVAAAVAELVAVDAAGVEVVADVVPINADVHVHVDVAVVIMMDVIVFEAYAIVGQLKLVFLVDTAVAAVAVAVERSHWLVSLYH